MIHYNLYGETFISLINDTLQIWNPDGTLIRSETRDDISSFTTHLGEFRWLDHFGNAYIEDHRHYATRVQKIDMDFCLHFNGNLTRGDLSIETNVRDFKVLPSLNHLITYYNNGKTVILSHGTYRVNRVFSGTCNQPVTLHENELILIDSYPYTCYDEGAFGLRDGSIEYQGNTINLFDQPVLSLAVSEYNTILATDGETIKWYNAS